MESDTIKTNMPDAGKCGFQGYRNSRIMRFFKSMNSTAPQFLTTIKKDPCFGRTETGFPISFYLIFSVTTVSTTQRIVMIQNLVTILLSL
jgi:hypothetical protein